VQVVPDETFRLTQPDTEIRKIQPASGCQYDFCRSPIVDERHFHFPMLQIPAAEALG